MISRESTMHIFRNCKYLSLCHFFFNTDSSFQKYQMLTYHFLLSVFLTLSWKCLVIILFFSPHVPCPQSYYLSQEPCWTASGDQEFIFSSSNFVSKLWTMTWWLQSYSLAQIWHSLVLDVPGWNFYFLSQACVSLSTGPKFWYWKYGTQRYEPSTSVAYFLCDFRPPLVFFYVYVFMK